MLHALGSLLEPAVMDRATLLANHILRSEPAATARLQPHAGKTLRVEFTGWPAMLPAPPTLSWRLTPAGLLEWTGRESDAAADLLLRMDASRPAALVARAIEGQRPQADIQGEAALAEVVGWLMAHLRWDMAADLERVFPLPVAQALTALGSTVARGLRAALQRLPSALKPGP